MVFAEITADEARGLLSGGNCSLYAFEPRARKFVLLEVGGIPDDEFLSDCYVVTSSRPEISLLDVSGAPGEFDVRAVRPASGRLSSVRSLERAIDDTMESPQVPWQCPVCGEVLPDRAAYDAHLEWCVEGRG